MGKSFELIDAMADPITHALLGAACVPEHPVAGAVFGLLPDVIHIPMNAYTLVKYRKLATERNWALSPVWMRRIYGAMHGLFVPAFFLFWSWWFMTPLVPLCLAYLSHIVIDARLHWSTTILWPLKLDWLIGYGQDWWTDWRFPATTITISALVAGIRLGIL